MGPRSQRGALRRPSRALPQVTSGATNHRRDLNDRHKQTETLPPARASAPTPVVHVIEDDAGKYYIAYQLVHTENQARRAAATPWRRGRMTPRQSAALTTRLAA